MMYKNTKQNKAFTLVETLVAIAILMISVAGPLVVASKGLNAALYAKDQMIASLLAQEGMEVVKNVRSNCLFMGCGGEVGVGTGAWAAYLADCLEDQPCDASALPVPADASTASDVGFAIRNCPSDIGCTLKFDPATGYGADVSGQDSGFKRYFYREPAGAYDDNGISINSDTVTVVVKWKHGLVDNELKLSSELSDAVR